MAELESDKDKEHRSKLDIVGSFLEQQALKGKLLIEHSVGLGPKPNVIPPGEASVNGALRTVHIGWHPVAGLGGKWFAEQTGLGKLITENIHNYPDPTQHWAVLVDDYVHELWIDENLEIIYINEKLVESEWKTFVVGKTHFNDEALKQAAEMTIHHMRSKRPVYNLISNNCQNFALALLDAIQVGSHKRFATSFAVYQRATGKGSIKDLFSENDNTTAVTTSTTSTTTTTATTSTTTITTTATTATPDNTTTTVATATTTDEQEDSDDDDEEETAEQKADYISHLPKLEHTNTLQAAQQIMDKYTTKLDRHYHGFFHRS